jgi:uncharacterized protein (TIGR03067 family)
MTIRIAGLVAIGLFLFGSGRVQADDQKDIQGIWKVEKAVRGGKDMPTEEKDKIKLEFKDGKAIVHEGEKEKPAEVTLDPTTKPKNITIKPEGENKEHLGIYELKGDTLKICFAREAGERPKEFKSEEGTEIMLIELKREKK